jgi:uncharacterized cysteine cluster protein YcgN (CxxCxxCC family)
MRLPVVHEMLGRVYSDREWEALCDGCGQCCFESRWQNQGWVHTSIPCRFLDDFDRSCHVYGNRFQAQTDCIRVTPSVVMSGILPETCAYRDELARIVEEDYDGQDPRHRVRARKRNGSRKRKRR